MKISKIQKQKITEEKELQNAMTHVVDKQIKPVFKFVREAMIKYPDNSLSVIFEDLVAEPMKTLNHVEKFLELGVGFDEDNVTAIMGKDIVSQSKF